MTALTWDVNGKHPGESGFDPGNVDIWGYGGGNNVGTYAKQSGVDSVSTDGSCKAQVTEEGFVDALTFERDLRWKYYVQSSGDFAADQGFAAGKLSVFYNGSWFYNWFKEYPDFRPGVWYLPTIGANKGVWNDSHCHVLPLDLEADLLDWCKKLTVHIHSSHLWASEAGMPTPRASVAAHLQTASELSFHPAVFGRVSLFHCVPGPLWRLDEPSRLGHHLQGAADDRVGQL